MKPFTVTHPNGKRVPILLSIPHCGSAFPSELRQEFKNESLSRPDDTDWFVDKLYDFAPEIGITIISSVFHRWIIDLNRAEDDKPLYTDGRIITGLCPTTDFLGNTLYKDDRTTLSDKEVARRLDLYYHPYHKQLVDLMSDIKSEFGKVLLWECHSIRQYVPTIYREKFPDLILGDSEGACASPSVIKAAYDSLAASGYSLSHNFPFKGGHITRAYGKPLHHEEALQLEMTKINYMDDKEIVYDDQRAASMRTVLRQTLSNLVEHLMTRH